MDGEVGAVNPPPPPLLSPAVSDECFFCCLLLLLLLFFFGSFPCHLEPNKRLPWLLVWLPSPSLSSPSPPSLPSPPPPLFAAANGCTADDRVGCHRKGRGEEEEEDDADNGEAGGALVIVADFGRLLLLEEASNAVLWFLNTDGAGIPGSGAYSYTHKGRHSQRNTKEGARCSNNVETVQISRLV